MKREIKFRAWDGEKMVEVAELHLNTKELLVDDEEWLSMRYSPLMQYTGLHDKNGQEIYEGDLFERRFGYTVFDDVIHEEMGTEYGAVVLEDGQFGVKIPGLGVYNLYGLLLRDGHLDNMPKDDLFVMKIAGNIHDNQELLEADK